MTPQGRGPIQSTPPLTTRTKTVQRAMSSGDTRNTLSYFFFSSSIPFILTCFLLQLSQFFLFPYFLLIFCLISPGLLIFWLACIPSVIQCITHFHCQCIYSRDNFDCLHSYVLPLFSILISSPFPSYSTSHNFYHHPILYSLLPSLLFLFSFSFFIFILFLFFNSFFFFFFLFFFFSFLSHTHTFHTLQRELLQRHTEGSIRCSIRASCVAGGCLLLSIVKR